MCFGLTLHPEHGGNSRDYIEYDDGYVQKAEQIIEQFEADGADLILGLTHLHLASDIEIAKLKRRHPMFKFIVGGHEHEVQRHSGDANTADVMKGASNAPHDLANRCDFLRGWYRGFQSANRYRPVNCN